jgi:mannose-6-phosphate isomerase-like protein (cupin superfamily)
VEIIEAAGQYLDPGQDGSRYVEHLSRADLSVGTYSLRAGATDLQSPRAEDEVYVVMTGQGRFTAGGDSSNVAAGSVLFVPAHEPHCFHDITQDLGVLVFFGPGYGSRENGAAQEECIVVHPLDH